MILLTVVSTFLLFGIHTTHPLAAQHSCLSRLHRWRVSTPHNQPSDWHADICYHCRHQSATQYQRCIRPFQPRERPTWPPSSHRYSVGVPKPCNHCLRCPHQSWPHSNYSCRCHRTTNCSVRRITHQSNPQSEGVPGQQKALKQQLLSAFDDMYYRSLRKRHTGYTMVTTRQILDHLYAAYSQLLPQDPKIMVVSRPITIPHNPSRDYLTKLRTPSNLRMPLKLHTLQSKSLRLPLR